MVSTKFFQRFVVPLWSVFFLERKSRDDQADDHIIPEESLKDRSWHEIFVANRYKLRELHGKTDYSVTSIKELLLTILVG